uniref:ACB domain-containing protein n=1 Tax=Populus davidiana TaxID=266767 RepID=A0A6M2ESB2_9ROSI
MADWQQLLPSIFIGLLFSYLLAKLISIVVSFQNDNLHITRNPQSPKPQSTNTPTTHHHQHSHGDVDSVVAEQGSVRNDSLSGNDSVGDDEDDDDDDWEGVESTELDEMFSAATAFVAATAADRNSLKVSSDLQLQLYGYYKIATEGPCTSPPPSALKMTARAKWQAWQKLGAMPPEDAMQEYIDIVTELYPTWASGSTVKIKGRDGDGQSTDGKGPMGPVFSTFVYEEESETELKMDAIHAFAREGEVNNLLKCIDSGVSVNLRDSEGRTPLHWAVDRGHLDIAEELVGKNADINAKDNEGQTPLHYATVCEREAIAEYLVKQNANTDAKDNDGQSARDLCESDWPFLRGVAS